MDVWSIAEQVQIHAMNEDTFRRMAQRRHHLRQMQQFVEADAIRTQLQSYGQQVQDFPHQSVVFPQAMRIPWECMSAEARVALGV